MEHVAIDLGGRESQICVRSPDGVIVQEARCSTARLEAFLKQRPHSRVIVETSAEAFAVADGALRCGHEVRVVPSMLAKTLGVGDRGVKTDRRDAQALSLASCRLDLPSVHVPSARARVLKSTCTSREALVSARTQLVNSARGWLRQQVVSLRCRTESFPARVRELLLAREEGLPTHLEHVLAAIDSLNVQIAVASSELEGVAKDDPVCQRLMTVPGVGPVTAVRYLAALDERARFRNAHAVQSYLGLTPGEDSSSDRRRKTGITKAGPPRVRWALTQACWCALRTRPKDPMVIWAQQIALRRGKAIAVVALARKMAGILFAIWRDGTTYRTSQEKPPTS